MKREQSKIEKDVLESMKDKIVDLLNHTDNELKAKGISNRAPIYIGYGIGETISRSGIVNENVSLSNFQIMDFILGEFNKSFVESINFSASLLKLKILKK